MAKLYYFYGRRLETPDRDKEPNQAPVLIQPHGAIIVIKEPELTILQVSANTESHFGVAPEELLGQPLSQLIGETEVERLRDQFTLKNPESATQYLKAARIGRGNKVFELLIHRFHGLLILECERIPDDAIPQFELYPSVNNAITQMQRAESARDVCQRAADEMRRLTGFDRAMVYKFNADDSGEVIAESLGGDFESYLGLRMANCKLRSGNQGLRVVVDVDGAPSPLVPPGDGAPPDLRRAVTRNLSPAHIQHLSHLGVKASMFIPIIRPNVRPNVSEDRLWGLIALHHHTGPKYVPHNVRMACECMARFLSAQTALKERADKDEHNARGAEGRKRLEEIMRLNIELERSNIELDSFASIASHDLKEPLRGIRNYSNFLLEDYADKLEAAGMEKLRAILKLSQRMETLLDSLLYYSRVGRYELAMDEVALDDVVSETLETLAPRLRESGAEVRRPRPLPTVRANLERVGEIFDNLIVNAIKYNDKASKWIEIGWEEGAGERGSGRAGEGVSEVTREEVTLSQALPLSPSLALSPSRSPAPPLSPSRSPAPPISPCPALSPSSSPAPHLSPSPVFYVRDNGIGIPERHYETIFGIFKRLHERDQFGGGVGAGLTIVKKIVERHNGRIWVESRVGAGTTIYFTLG